MFKRINNLHLSVLIGIVSIFSLLLIQQYVVAQTWVDPEGLPGETQDNTFVVNPITDDLDIGTYDRSIVGDSVKLDGASTQSNALIVQGGRKICLGGTTADKCLADWPTVSGGVTTPGGTAGYIPKFTSSEVLDDSIMYETIDTQNGANTKTIWMGSDNAGLETAQLVIETLSTNGGRPLLTLRNNGGWGGSDMLNIRDGGNGDAVYIAKGSEASDTGNAIYINNIGSGPSLYIEDFGSGEYDDNSPFVLDANGNLGIGTASPSKQLHIRAASGNAEMDIQSGGTAGDNSHWGIYHSHPTTGTAGTQDNLVFWKKETSGVMKNRVMFTNQGDILLDGEICDIDSPTDCFSYADIGGGATNYWTEDVNSNLSRTESNVYLVANGQALPAAAAGASARMVWYPNKNAFRVGEVTGTEWDDSSIGDDSTAFGLDNTVSGNKSVIGGGWMNSIVADTAVIGGGRQNSISNTFGLTATIGGGYNNQIIKSVQGTIAGGGSNKIGDSVNEKNGATIGGGVGNVNNASMGVIAGGGNNYLNFGENSVIGGGYSNQIDSWWSFIGGGEDNYIDSGVTTAYGYSVIGGGKMNTTTEAYTFIGGGYHNSVAGKYASVIGGTYNKADGDSSFAGGQGMQLSSTADNSFVWGSTATTTPLSITRDNTFAIFPTNPSSGSAPRVGIGTASPNKTLHVKSTMENAEIDIQSGTSPYWAIYQDDTTDELRLWHNGANIAFFKSKGFGVTSTKDTNYYYIQMDKTDVLPPGADCDEATEVGRMLWKDSVNQIIVCGSSGWRVISS